MKRQLTLILSLLTLFLSAQTFHYGYDASGNRISRTVTYPRIANDGGNPEAVNEQQENQEELSSQIEALEVALESTSISIYPNPARYVVNVSYGSENTLTEEVRILDAQGKMLFNRKDITGDFQLPFGNYAPGNYFLWLKIKGKTERFQIIKE